MSSTEIGIFPIGDFLRSNSHGGNFLRIEAGQAFYRQGEDANSVYWLQRGSAKMVVVSDQGREAIVGVLTAADFFGQQCLMGHRQRITSILALENCEAFRFSKKNFDQLLHKSPLFATYFTSYLLTRNIRLEGDLVDHLFNSSEKRLARLLLILSNIGTEKRVKSEFISLNQETLAQMIGTTRARVSSFMNKFREFGFIEYNGDISVNNSLLNVVLYDDPYIKKYASDKNSSD